MAKTDARMQAIGDVDEANSAIGLAVASLAEGDHAIRLRRIQNDLFDLGADLATPGDSFEPGEMTLRITPAQVSRLEDEIDAMNESLAPLRSFILPGGSSGAAALHLARAIVRRAERTAVAASHGVNLNPAALTYLNRLSDHLFVSCRALNADGEGDILWVPGASR
ncbi:cob(I)alamin adenosyltransferase [Sphingobium boeckii]|uniref:Corrinoid adenosyltransferase n=1 Tax=Sphingobium boeckii TaxID=1082345 RepID=A0A7W9AL54_9SPHN|nr:cob(I)alamin adenosyltransferase [Sphingobium boeckii]